MSKKSIIVIGVLLSCFIGFTCVGDNVFAVGNNGWSASGTPGSYSGGGSGDCKDVAGGAGWMVSCKTGGLSWMYYKAIGSSTSDIYLPYPGYLGEYMMRDNNGDYARVSSECSNNGNGGFWTFGHNAQNVGYYNVYSFSDGSRALQFDSQGNGGSISQVALTFYGHWAPAVWSSSYVNSGNYNAFVFPSLGTHQRVGNYEAEYTGDYNTVKRDYNKYLEYTGQKSKNEPDRELPDGLYAFCSWDFEKFYGESTASVGNSSTTTGIVAQNSAKIASPNAEIQIEINNTAKITFTHSLYSSEANKSIGWSVSRANNLPSSNCREWSGDGYRVNNCNLESRISGTAQFGNREQNGYYTVKNKVGNNNYIVKDEYDVRFTKEGSYLFCEMLTVGDGVYTSRACVNVIVGDSGTIVAGECPEEYYVSGESAVLSLVKNNALSGAFSGWRGTLNVAGENNEANVTYAKPGDKVQWLNCYYPGAQVNANKNVVYINGNDNGRHGSHDTWWNTNNSYVKFQNGITWNNIFSVTTTSPYGLNGSSNSYSSETTVRRNLSNGATNVVSVSNNYKPTNNTSVGQVYDDYIKTEGNTPSYTSVVDDTPPYHSWSGLEGDYGYNLGYPDICTPIYDENGVKTGENCKPDSRWYSWYVTRSHNNKVILGEFRAGLLESQAFVKVPYNFVNTASLNISSSVAYAGERVNVDNVVVQVGTRYNNVTESTYATRVDNAQVRMVAYVTGEDRSGYGSSVVRSNSSANICSSNYIGYSYDCDVVQSYSNRALNALGKLSGATHYGSIQENGYLVAFDGFYNVYDEDAGKYFCMAIAVYPYTSGDDKNLDPEGDYSWYVSSPDCVIIAKKPSFQVWGGSLASDGNVTTAVSNKRVIWNVFGYTPFSEGSATVFGSWVEQAVISNGEVKGLASGAASGLANNNVGSGSKEGTNFSLCNYRAPLSFANYGDKVCGSDMNMTGKFGASSTVLNRAALADYWGSAGGDVGSVSVNLGAGDFGSAIGSATGKDIRYLASSGTVTIGNSYINPNMTRIVKAASVMIGDNIVYNDGGYDSLQTVPKAVIYSSGNITIGCNVNRVDAILIAEGSIYTCDEYIASGTVREYARSNQLKINGALIGDTLILGRTYGNTKGVNSGTPAEVINYDSSALLWGASMASAEESDTLTVTYQHELAPRY